MNQSVAAIRHQDGAALITALVMMTIMTLLAITSMGTNTLEEKMASNAQESNRAFQAAESGLAKVLALNAAFDTGNKVDDNGTPFNLSDDIYDFNVPYQNVGDTSLDPNPPRTKYQAEFRQKTVPKRSAKGWNLAIYSFYHFDLSATGTTFSGVSTTLHAGAYQVGPK